MFGIITSQHMKQGQCRVKPIGAGRRSRTTVQVLAEDRAGDLQQKREGLNRSTLYCHVVMLVYQASRDPPFPRHRWMGASRRGKLLPFHVAHYSAIVSRAGYARSS